MIWRLVVDGYKDIPWLNPLEGEFTLTTYLTIGICVRPIYRKLWRGGSKNLEIARIKNLGACELENHFDRHTITITVATILRSPCVRRTEQNQAYTCRQVLAERCEQDTGV